MEDCRLLKPDGQAAIGVKCSECKKIEWATPTESRTSFVASLKLAGWRWKIIGQKWLCERCLAISKGKGV